MSADEFVGQSNLELLQTHARVIEELRRRHVLRSKNNPVGDYAEWLVSTSLGLTLEGKSAAGFDALDAAGCRYQIKARRVTADNGSRQMGIIRNLGAGLFDALIGVLFRPDFTVMAAYQIPRVVVEEQASFKPHTNGHVIHLRGQILKDERVQEISSKLQWSGDRGAVG